MKTFSHNYKLIKDIPAYKAGRTIGWNGERQKFYFRAISEWKYDNGAEGIYLDYEGTHFTVEQAKDKEWFTPMGKEKDFIPQFPSEEKIKEYVYLLPECRLVNDVDECRAINGLINDKGFQKKLYSFYKKEYKAFYKI